MVADLGVNHVERQILLCGFTLERVERDYGIDLLLFTYNAGGEPESGEVRIQVKATEHLKAAARQPTVAFRLERAHLQSWLAEPMPVVLIVYDVSLDRAYWLYVQAYFEAQRNFNPRKMAATVTVNIPRSQILDPAAVRQFAGFRDRVLAQLEGFVHHEQ